MKKKIWVLIANSNKAKIFRLENARKLVEVEKFEHPESRLADHDLVTDRPGRSFESTNNARHAMEPKTSPKKNEFNIFARDLSHILETAKNNGEFETLYIAANPSFLGILRQILPSSIKELIAMEVDKDLTHLNADDVSDHFFHTNL